MRSLVDDPRAAAARAQRRPDERPDGGRRRRPQPQAARGPARRPGRDRRPRRRTAPGRCGADRDHGRQATGDGTGRDLVAGHPRSLHLVPPARASPRSRSGSRATGGGRSSGRSPSERSSPALLVLVARSVAGNYVVDNLVKTESVRPAASDTWDILTALLRDGARTLVGVGLVLLIGVWLVGPGARATALRRAPGAVARAPGDRLRRRGARAGAARLVGADGADPAAGRSCSCSRCCSASASPRWPERRERTEAVSGPGDAPTPLPPPA